MPKKSTKSKSKRTTLKQKYKLIKKVKEHHKKKRRVDAKKKRLGIKPPAPKDPGLPTQWPYKEELMHEINFESEKRRNFEEAKSLSKAFRRAESRKRSRAKGVGLPLENLEVLRQGADKRGDAFNLKTNILDSHTAGARVTSDIDNSRRAHFREFLRVVEASDVIIQVLDVRDPLASRSLEVEHIVRSSNPHKRVVLLLNKIDLVPRDNVKAWLKYFREEIPCVVFKCATGSAGSSSNKLGSRALPTQGTYGGKDALGAETLLQLLKNYARSRNLKRAITVGIVGFPNVGKSSLINSLKRSRYAAAVGNTPGFTTVSKEITLDKQIKLIDSPGVIFASSLGESAGSVALRNCIKIEKLTDPIAPVGEILRRCPAEQLMLLYGTGKFADTDSFLRQVGRVQGKLKKGGIPDLVAAARVGLNDWNCGSIPYYNEPPERCSTADEIYTGSEVVTKWSNEFNVQEGFAEEESTVIAGIPSASISDLEFLSSKSAGAAKLDTIQCSKDNKSEGSIIDKESNKEDRSEDSVLAKRTARNTQVYPSRSDGPNTLGSSPVNVKSSMAQITVLYESVGQLNPNQLRAVKRKTKKIKATIKTGLGRDESGSEYNWD